MLLWAILGVWRRLVVGIDRGHVVPRLLRLHALLILRISLRIRPLLWKIAWLLSILSLLRVAVLIGQCDLDGLVAVIELVSVDGVQNQRPPVSRDGLGVADKLPLGLLGLGEKLDSQVLIRREDVLYFGEIELALEFGKVGFLMERDQCFFGDVSGVADGLVALED